MNIQIPIIGQQTRVGFVPQDNQSPIVDDDERGAALQNFGQSLGDLASGVAAWQKKQPQSVANDPPADAGLPDITIESGNPPPADAGNDPPAYHPLQTDPVARQDYEVAKSAACYAVPTLRNTAARIFADARQNLGPSQAGLVPEVLGKYDSAVEQALQACTTPESRLYVTEYAKQGRQQLARQALLSEAQAGIAERANRYQASADAWARVVASDPGQIAQALTALHHGAPDLDPEHRAAARDNARATLIHAGIMAEIARNPRGAYDDIVRAGGREDGAPGATAEAPGAASLGTAPAATISSIMTPAEREHYAPLAQAALYDQRAKQFEAFKTRQADTDAAYMATGTAQNPPTEPEFIEHYGEEEGQRLFGQQRITARAGQVRQFVKTLPAHALVDLREQTDPDIPEGAAVHHVIDEVEKARRADPIAYALQNGSYGLSPITSFEDAQALNVELGKRARAAESIQRDYQTTATVLSKQEGLQLAKTLQGKPAEEQLALLQQITAGIGDPQVRDSALRTLSAQAPVAALAGRHQAGEALDPDQAQGWGGDGKIDASTTLLAGNALLNPPADQSGAQPYPMPPDGETRRAYAGQRGRMGNPLGDAPGAEEMIYAGARAAYASLSLQAGDSSGKFDAVRWDAAVKLAMKGSGTAQELGLDGSKIGEDTGQPSNTMKATSGRSDILLDRPLSTDTSVVRQLHADLGNVGLSQGGTSNVFNETGAGAADLADVTGIKPLGSDATAKSAEAEMLLAQNSSGQKTRKDVDDGKAGTPTSEGLPLKLSPELSKVPVLGSDLSGRRKYVIKGGGAVFPIESNPSADATKPIIEFGAFNNVNNYSKFIDAAAWKWGIDADIIRAIMYMEQSHGYYDRIPQIIDANRTILPMNVHDTLWGDFVGTRKQLLDPKFNINAGTKILANIRENLSPKDRDVAKIATLYNKLGATKVTDYGARVAAIYEAKPWIKR